ncbi:MAG: phosphodiester glycosidase family protein [Gaiellaceae bacterium]
MVRRLAIAVLAVAVFYPSTSVAVASTVELWPGVTFQQTVDLSLAGPVVIDILTGPRPGGTTTLRPFLTSGVLTRRQTLTAAERQVSSVTTLAGINGDFFNFNTGVPSGVLLQDGQLLSPPSPDRASAVITSDGTLSVGRLSLTATWRGSGSSHAITAFERLPGPSGVSLFTSAWGPSTPSLPGSVAVVLFPFPSTSPGVPLLATVQELDTTPSVPIPLGGAVLVARGVGAALLRAEAPVGASVTVQLSLPPFAAGAVGAIGGGPQIVRNGVPVFRAGEAFLPSQLVPVDPRSAVGQLADGRIVLVAVDGRQPGWSVGLTNFQLAQRLVRMGAVTAFAFDSGGSTTVAFDGKLLNRPSDGRERPISTALAFAYTGVLATASASAVSPNGDGVDDVEALRFKLVNPSAVSLTLQAPDGSAAFSQTLAAQPPGVYPVPFPVVGRPLTEGRWKLAVTATDDLGQQSTMTQLFTVDNSIGFLAVSSPRLFLPPGGRDLTISWKMGAPARVVATVETKDGVVVRKLAAGKFPAGDKTVVWNGLDRTGKRVKGGVYRAHLVARSAVGTVELVKTFAVRQIVGPPKGS